MKLEEERRRRHAQQQQYMSAQELDAEFEVIFDSAADNGATEALRSLTEGCSLRPEADEIGDLAALASKLDSLCQSRCSCAEFRPGSQARSPQGGASASRVGSPRRGDSPGGGMMDRTMSQVYRSVRSRINQAALIAGVEM